MVTDVKMTKIGLFTSPSSGICALTAYLELVCTKGRMHGPLLCAKGAKLPSIHKDAKDTALI